MFCGLYVGDTVCLFAVWPDCAVFRDSGQCMIRNRKGLGEGYEERVYGRTDKERLDTPPSFREAGGQHGCGAEKQERACGKGSVDRKRCFSVQGTGAVPDSFPHGLPGRCLPGRAVFGNGRAFAAGLLAGRDAAGR